MTADDSNFTSTYIFTNVAHTGSHGRLPTQVDIIKQFTRQLTLLRMKERLKNYYDHPKDDIHLIPSKNIYMPPYDSDVNTATLYWQIMLSVPSKFHPLVT